MELASVVRYLFMKIWLTPGPSSFLSPPFSLSFCHTSRIYLLSSRSPLAEQEVELRHCARQTHSRPSPSARTRLRCIIASPRIVPRVQRRSKVSQPLRSARRRDDDARARASRCATLLAIVLHRGDVADRGNTPRADISNGSPNLHFSDPDRIKR